jgi:DNA-binding NtrC family response regulator
MVGEALFHALKAKNRHLKMVLMSGYPLDKKGSQLLAQGLTAWFEKPVSLEQLSRVISKVLAEETQSSW